MFAALIAYQKANGNCDVPFDTKINQPLAIWETYQRVLWKRGNLSESRVQRLNKLNFTWSPKGEVWEEMFAELVRYKRQHGNCDVPYQWQENPKLGKWLVYQRQLRRCEKLTEGRHRRLAELGVIWNSFTSAWEKSFASLARYKQENGNCNVPRGWIKNPQLATWVRTMRRFKKCGRLAKERIHRLNQIGFQW